MIRIFTIFIMMILTSMGYAQNAPVNFESGGQGASWTWTVFENDTDPPLEVVPNPDPSGINTSATVAKFTALQAGQPYVGVESAHGSDIGTYTLGMSNNIIKIMVWKSVISDVGIKLVSSNGWSLGEVKVANTKVNQWEQLTFNFASFSNPPLEEGPYDQIVIFPDFTARSQDNIIYFDNITFHPSTPPPPAPVIAAPTPTRSAADVISLYSDAYSDVTVDTWNATWSSGTLEDIAIEGNATKKYTDLDIVGIETIANQLDLSGMTHMHLDIWSPNFSSFGVKLVDFGADGEGPFEDQMSPDDVEHQVNYNALTRGEWLSLDIALSDFIGLTTKSNIAQLIFVGIPIGSTTLFVDNVYFYTEGPQVPPGPYAPINFEAEGNGADWSWTVFDNDTNPALEIIDNPFSTGINTSAKVAKVTALQTGEIAAGVQSSEGDLGTFQWDQNNRIVKVVVYKSEISDVGIKFDTGTSGDSWSSGEVKVANTKINEWEELTFDFSSAPNPPAASGGLKRIIIFPDFIDRTQDNIIYFDNVTFETVPPPVEPQTAAPTPTRATEDVISLFSDAYDDVTVDSWRTSWSSAVLEDIAIEGNATKKYSEMDVVGIETVANQLDISEMTHFHIDVWSPNFTFFNVKLVDFGADGAFDGGDDVEHTVNFNNPNQGQWVSLDIPISEFTGLTTKSNIAQYILTGQPVDTATIFIDNVYFYKEEIITVVGPTEPAPTPTRPAADVISLFSDVYSDLPVDSWRTSWSSAVLEDIAIVGNATKKYTDVDVIGIETVSTQPNISNMTHFHIDVWSSNFTSFGVKLVDFGADNAFEGGDDVEHQIDFDNPNQGEWVSLDIPLSDFTGLTTKSNLAQYILTVEPTGTAVIYIDNVYFYSDGTTSVDTKSNDDLIVYPNPVKSGNQILLTSPVKKVDLYDINGKLVKSVVFSQEIDTEGLLKGVYILSIQKSNGTMMTKKLIIN